jgi:hypothetical protein
VISGQGPRALWLFGRGVVDQRAGEAPGSTAAGGVRCVSARIGSSSADAMQAGRALQVMCAGDWRQRRRRQGGVKLFFL